MEELRAEKRDWEARENRRERERKEVAANKMEEPSRDAGKGSPRKHRRVREEIKEIKEHTREHRWERRSHEDLTGGST